MSADAPEFIDTLHGHALANDGLLLLTDDGGQQWRGVPLPAAVLNVPRVLFANAGKGWAFERSSGFGGARAFVTTDGAATWQPLPPLPVSNVMAAWGLGPDRVMVNGSTPSSFDTLSFLSEDGGRSWRSLGRAFTSVTPAGIMHAEDLNGLWLSTNGGATSRLIARRAEYGGPPALDLSDPKRLQLIMEIGVGYEHRASSDGGLTWTITSIDTPPDLSLRSSWQMRLEGNAGLAMGYTASGQEALLRSADGGRHWSVAPLPPGITGQGDILIVRLHGTSLLTLDARGGVFWASGDAAQSWHPVRPPGDPSEVLAVSAAGGGVLHASTGEYKVETTTPCELPIFTSHCTHTTTIVHRRYVSTDGGATWRLMPGGQPITP